MTSTYVPREPWATVKVSIEFAGDQQSYVTAVALYEGDKIVAGMDAARDLALNSLVRDAASYRAMRGLAAMFDREKTP